MITNLSGKNITLFLPRLHNNLRPLIDLLIQLDYEVTVLALRSGKVEDYSGITYIKIQKRNIVFNKYLNQMKLRNVEILSLRQISQFFRINKPDLLMIRNDSNFAYIPILIFGKIYRCKIILYNQYPKNNPTRLQFLFNLFFYKAFGLKTVTPVLNKFVEVKTRPQYESLVQYRLRLTKELENDKSNDATNWFPFISNYKNNGLVENRSESIKILSVGKLQKRKNHDKVILLLNTFAESRGTNIELTIVGELHDSEINYLKVLQALISDKVKVNILTNVTHSDITKIYEYADIFILLSEKEIASVSQVEAFSAGCKIIMFNENGNLDFLPANPMFQIVSTSSEFNKSLDTILSYPADKSTVLAYASVYNELCGGYSYISRFLDLF